MVIAKNRQRATCYGGAANAPPENIVPDLSQKGRVHEEIESKNRQRAGLLRGAFDAQRENLENIVPDLSQKGRVREISSREEIEAQKRKREGALKRYQQQEAITLAPAGARVDSKH